MRPRDPHGERPELWEALATLALLVGLIAALAVAAYARAGEALRVAGRCGVESAVSRGAP